MIDMSFESKIECLSTKEALYKRPMMYFGPNLNQYVKDSIDIILKEVDGKIVSSFLADSGITIQIKTNNSSDLWYYKGIQDTCLSEILEYFHHSRNGDILNIRMRFDPAFLNKYFLMSIGVGV